MTSDLQELLPFYVNGTLKGAERQSVEQALRDDPALQNELDYLKGLRAEVKAQDFGTPPGELGLKRLQRSIAAEKLKNDPIARARSKITREQNNWWKVAAIAACLLILLQAVFLFQPDYNPDLSAAGGPNISASTSYMIDVTFAPTAQEQNIRDLLLSLDAVIVDGPSALGVYTLSVPKEREAAIEKLRAHQSLIESANKKVRP